MKPIRTLLLSVALVAAAHAQPLEPKPADPYFGPFKPLQAPKPTSLQLKKGDRLAIIGDSITEQKMYSRIMETYLTVCVPDMEVTVRQYGWSGERAPGFAGRMTNDCLRFNPTIATTCYGMNDHEYKPYEPRIGDTYRKFSTAIVQSFKANGVRVVHGSPGNVWVTEKSRWKDEQALAQNLNLCELRNIGIEIAKVENAGFADVFWPMLVASKAGSQKYGPKYSVPGSDGFHPNWAGQTVMAYAFLKSFGLDGEIGAVTVDLKSGTATASKGHDVVSSKAGEVQIKSARYPFCATGAPDNYDSIRSAMTLIPFNEELNRLMLVAKNASAKSYKVTWGAESKSYSAEQLGKGVNLASDFAVNPFSDAFKKVDDAVAAKQAYETRQIKELFHGREGQADMDATVALTEKVRAPLAAAVRKAFVPVTHTLKITAE